MLARGVVPGRFPGIFPVYISRNAQQKFRHTEKFFLFLFTGFRLGKSMVDGVGGFLFHFRQVISDNLQRLLELDRIVFIRKGPVRVGGQGQRG